MKHGYLFLIVSLSLFLIFTACRQPAEQKGEKWNAPEEAAKLTSPLQHTGLAGQKGKALYNLYCLSCHGETGYGDGAAGTGLAERPANFHSKSIQSQANGSLFWKLSNGRKEMPAFKEALSEEQRWQLVAYIRQVADMPEPLQYPKALKPGISVEHFLKIDSLAVRILQHPLTGTIWYTTFDGNIFRIKNQAAQPAVAEKMFTVKDHGITRLQGAAFLNNDLFLSGNVDSTLKKSTHGRLVRLNLDTAVRSSVVFTSAEYGANKTVYDHGWNALEISPDGKYIYVNSGARTDHGEVQDNGGMFPFARDNALTAKVFRLPIDALDLLLPDDTTKLRAAGYIYAEGIRNAYDMAFDEKGNLFGVSNSPDYDMPEDMFWIRQHHHYGFPWIMGGIENPQQYRDWNPDPETDPFIPATSHSWRVKYFNNDTAFPRAPAGVKFSPGVQNLGPDANEYRGHSGKILDGDQTGVAVSTFTAHCSPLALFFDTKKILANDLRGDGFVMRYSLGSRSSMMRPFTSQGADLLHLDLEYDGVADNYIVRTNRIVDGFKEPTDAILVGNVVYVIEYGGKGGNIWKITLPKESKLQNNIPGKKP
ncbi:MAG: c-type cytochrome [Ferruginibacter sp.]